MKNRRPKPYDAVFLGLSLLSVKGCAASGHQMSTDYDMAPGLPEGMFVARREDTSSHGIWAPRLQY